MPRQVDIPKVGTVEFPDSMSQDEISLAAKKLYRDAGGEPPRSQGVIPKGASPQQRESSRRVADLTQKSGIDQQEQIEKDAETKERIRVATMLPFALAAPFTAGASLEAGMLIMGGAGLAGGVGREAIQLQTSGKTKSAQNLANSLGIDLAEGMLGEAGGRGAVGTIKYMGGTVLPKLLVKAASAGEKGPMFLSKAANATAEALTSEVPEDHMVDIGGPLKRALGRIESIPKGVADPHSLAEASKDETKQFLGKIADRLTLKPDGVSTHQPLRQLIEMKGEISQFAWKKKDLFWRHAEILKDFSEEVDGAIKKELKGIGPEAEALYKQKNMLFSAQKAKDVSLDMAERFIHNTMGRAAIGAIGGGIAGYKTGGIAGAAKDAAIGGVGTAVIPGLSTLILTQTLKNPEARGLFMKAVARGVEQAGGKKAVDEAFQTAAKAFLLAGAKKTIDAAKEAAPPVQAVAAQTPDTTAR